MMETISNPAELESDGRHWWHKPWARLALIWGVWTFIGLVFTGQFYFSMYRSDRPVEWTYAFYLQMTWAYLWALATPVILWLAERFPIERKHLGWHLSLHVLASLALSTFVTWSGHFLLYLNYGYRVGRPYPVERALRFVVENFSEGIGIYLLVTIITYAFSYYNRYRKGELRAMQLEAQLSQAQLQALKMQLQPHFLFNTLHSISALLSRDTDKARTMITRLGDFLRLTLENSGSQEVTLQQEIEFLRCYLEIERVRFQDRLTTRVEIDPAALDSKVPNLILQPIVENAIRHGIAPRSTPGHIIIKAKQEDEILRIEVRDNGSGLPVNRKDENLFTKGVGLANTQTRLERLYGASHRFELTNDPCGGLVVTLEIPAKKGKPVIIPSQDKQRAA
ncbi:MAG TPA: histidine kinase [Pyrinomonadaceae bacterium]|jgi:signal transduction histidine kinase